MEAIGRFVSRVAVMPVDNVDTDQIIPARFLTTTERRGLGRACFADWRHDADGAREDFGPGGARITPDGTVGGASIARDARSCTVAGLRGAGVLVAGRNFGCGSSREHAAWALLDFGIRAVISTRIADIFRSNALKNGLLPIEVPDTAWREIAACAGREIAVDLETQRIELPDAAPIGFEIEAFARHCLLRGVDQLGYLLSQAEAIAAFERNRVT